MNMMAYDPVLSPRLAGWDRGGPASDSGSLLSPLGLLRLVRAKWRLVAAVLALAVAAAVAAALLLPRTYTAVAIVLIDPRQPRVAPSETVLSGIGSDAAAVESQVEVFQSSTLARKVVSQLGLDRDGELVRPAPAERLVAAVRDLLGMPAPSIGEAERENRIVQRFRGRLNVTRRGLTYVLEVAYASGDRENAARVANAVAAAYLADQAGAKSDATSRASGWLGERIEELRERARQAEAAVTAYRNDNRLVDLGQRETLLERQITDLTQQLTLAKARTAEARARYEQAKESARRPGGGGSVTESLQSAVIGNLRVQYGQLAASEADLRLTYGARHPALVNLRAQLRDVERQIATEVERVSAGLRNEFEAAQAREATLERDLNALREQMAGSNKSRDRLRELEREAQASRLVLEQFLLRFRETNQQQSMQTPDARVISPAIPPQAPSSPRTPLILALGVIGGLFAGIGAAALSDGLNPRFRDAADLEAALGLPVSATIPKGLTELVAGARGGAAENARLAQCLMPLVSELRRDGTRGQNKVAIVTSTANGEGRTTIASALADLLAVSGCRVLLADLDVTEAALSRQRGGERTPGLAQLLTGDFPTRPFIHADKDRRVDLLFAGASARAGPILPGPRLDRILRDLRPRYDVVLLDGPALLGSPPARSLLAVADQVVVVVAPERVSRDDVVSALAGIEFGSPSRFSVVLNGGTDRRFAA